MSLLIFIIIIIMSHYFYYYNHSNYSANFRIAHFLLTASGATRVDPPCCRVADSLGCSGSSRQCWSDSRDYDSCRWPWCSDWWTFAGTGHCRRRPGYRDRCRRSRTCRAPDGSSHPARPFAHAGWPPVAGSVSRAARWRSQRQRQWQSKLERKNDTITVWAAKSVLVKLTETEQRKLHVFRLFGLVCSCCCCYLAACAATVELPFLHLPQMFL